jgi:hypothetical protein
MEIPLYNQPIKTKRFACRLRPSFFILVKVVNVMIAINGVVTNMSHETRLFS